MFSSKYYWPGRAYVGRAARDEANRIRFVASFSGSSVEVFLVAGSLVNRQTDVHAQQSLRMETRVILSSWGGHGPFANV